MSSTETGRRPQRRRRQRCTVRSAVTPTPGSSTRASTDDGVAIRRRRQCPECGRRFTTVETASLTVVKRSGVTEPFSRAKVAVRRPQGLPGPPGRARTTWRCSPSGSRRQSASSGAAEIEAHEVGLADPRAAARARRGRLPAVRERLPGASSPWRTSRRRSRCCGPSASRPASSRRPASAPSRRRRRCTGKAASPVATERRARATQHQGRSGIPTVLYADVAKLQHFTVQRQARDSQE